ncbi:MAG TPA: LysM peptidoglycan-binding domain-containing protein [Oligoflexia bacterium]|nr:LysM peptidoglycan-binding domain-containing protein [Oligoflexia bacterium]HMR24606.1 LysM peptidoglycan-binding domain-containing protein [Oligoflexia bacterium]
MKLTFETILVGLVFFGFGLFAQALNSPLPQSQPEQQEEQELGSIQQDEQEQQTNSIPEYSDIEVIGPQGESSVQRPGTLRNIPNQTGEYIIVKGDTLWDICDRLLDNPWYWPKLWKLNTYIENPHLIYPGDKLYFDEGSNRSYPDMGFSNKDGFDDNDGSNDYDNSTYAGEGGFSGSTIVYNDGSKMVLRPIFFLTENTLQTQGHISHALANKEELTESDIVYIKMKPGVAMPKKGDRFYVIEEISELHARQNAHAGRLYGKIIRKNAVIEVNSVGSNTIEAVIISSDNEVRRNFELIAYQPQIISFDITTSNDRVKSKILGVTDQQIMIRDGDYVFIDEGEKSQLKPGTILYAVRKGDPLISAKENADLPELTYGKLVVVEVYKNSSMAYVTDVRDALEVGEILKTFVE